MTINRRKVRASLGSRRNRRSGTKTKCIPGTGGSKNIPNKYRYPRRQRTRPAVLVARKVKELIAKANADGNL